MHVVSVASRAVREIAGVLAGAAVVALLGATVLGRDGAAGSAAPAGIGSASEGRTAQNALPTSSPPLAIAATAAPSRPAASPGRCEPTRADPAFVPPKPFLARPPAVYEASWYGTARLFTMVDRVPAPKGPWLYDGVPLPDKTFWWSADWSPRVAPEPEITVTGRRLDGVGTFRAGDPGTNATADFGTAMLVGVDYPSVGCWQITAHYREATLAIVVQVVD